MIPAVSFGSTYKINQSFYSSVNQKRNLDELLYKCDKSNYQYSEDLYRTDKTERAATIVVPDDCDRDIESICNNLGIPFRKLYTNNLTSPVAIDNRINNAPKGMRKAKVDPDKLFDLIQRQPNNNIDYCELNYKKFFKDKTDFMIKSGDKIPATTLYISPYSGKENMIEYINRYGVENLNPDMMSIDFSQRTNDPDHCMFFAMIDAGLTEIPVYVNDESYETGKALGIII